MIAIVIVSHSRCLAEGVREVADQMASGQVTIIPVGGVQDEEGTHLGTDPMAVLQAIQAAWTPDGVLILADLGSAILSAETALEFLPPEQRRRCRISNAPLVEGAIVAALEASLGGSLDAVNAAAEGTGTLVKVARPHPDPRGSTP